MCGVNRKMLAKLLDGFEMPTIFRKKIRKSYLAVFIIEIKFKSISNFLVVKIFYCSTYEVLNKTFINFISVFALILFMEQSEI